MSMRVYISILAPSRERLRLPVDKEHVGLISILAPSRERLSRVILLATHILISILAPSRERPQSQCWSHRCGLDFNPRSLAGATYIRLARLLG